MATTGSYSTSTGTSLNLIAYYSYTQDKEANKSSVTVTLKLAHNRLNCSALSGSYLSIAGNKSSYSKTINHTSYTDTETTLATKTVSITHDSEGKGSCQIKAAFVFNGTVSGTYIGTLSINKTLTLTTIPRASSITKIANSSGTKITSLNSGSVVRIYWTPASSSYKYRVTCTVAGTTRTFPSSSTYYSPGSTSSYGTPASGDTAITTAHSWIPANTSSAVTVKLYTYNSSGTQIGSATSASFTLNIPDTVVPTITNFKATVVSGLGGYYVQGKSKVQLSVSATKGSGATGIKSYVFTGKNIYGTSSSRTISSTSTSYTLNSSTLQYDGDWSYTVTVYDSRGRKASAELEKDITVYPYSTPSITSISVKRCLKDGTVSSSGTYALVTVASKYASVNGANKRTVKLSDSSDNYGSSVTIQSTSNTSNKITYVYGDGSFAIGSTYTIKATITDTGYSATHEKTATLQTAERPINIAKYGNGVAIGGMSTITNDSASGLFECNWNTNINAKLFTTGNITTQGDLGCTDAYDNSNFAIYCQWADQANHDILVRSTDGLTMGLGWIGNDNYPTVLDVRPKTVNVRGTMTAPRIRLTATTDAAVDAQNDVAIRIGDEDGQHIDIDSNEIIAKDAPTTLGSLSFGGSSMGMYINEIDTFRVSSDSTSTFIRSVPTYERTYDASPNVYITSLGTFGRGTSSSQRYKKDIEDVTDDSLNPYNILNIPVRQFKYNAENIPINKDSDDLYIGLVAEEVANAYPVAAEYNEDGQVEMWNIKAIVPALLKIVQDQQKEINALKADVSAIKNQ